MALLFIDGFDHYGTGGDEYQCNDKGWVTGPNAYFSYEIGRFNYGKCIKCHDFDGWWKKDIGVNKSTLYFGAAIKKSSLDEPTYGASYPVIAFMDESDVIQVRFHVNPTYGIVVYNGAGTLLGTSSDSVFVNGYWQYIEIKVTISATVGEVIVRLNETQVLNLTSKDTKNGSDYIRYFLLRDIYNQRDAHFDDLYVDDAQFHGDMRIKTFLPDSISSTNNDFTASAGNKDECVDDNPSNEDTDYIVSDTLNHKQTFGITTGALGTVKAIQLNNHCRVDAGGSRKITPLIRSNSTNYSGTEIANNVPESYKFESEIWELDPDDSGAWTQTKLEAAEFGLEITA